MAYILLKLNANLKFNFSFLMHAFSEADLQAAEVPVWKSIGKNCRSSILYNITGGYTPNWM